MMRKNFTIGCAVSCAIFMFLGATESHAQLRITEVMYNTVDTDGIWEWIEVENYGATDIDFSSTPYVLDDDDGNNRTSANILQGIIPAGTRAIITDGFDMGFDGTDPRFSNAWGPGINVIGANNYPGWNNNGDRVGLWDSFTAYGNRDFSMATSQIDYTSIADAAQGGAPTVFWTGSGDSNDVANWAVSQAGVGGAYTSQASFIGASPGERLNDDDVANPGSVAISGAIPSSDPLIFTEIMYAPASNIGGDQAPFEWVEVYNNSGSPLDTTGYVFDDDFSSRKSAANVEGKVIPVGGVAVLYNGELVTESQMQDAWGNNLYISVSEWGNLFDGGETIALWPDLATYQLEANNAGDGDDPTVTPSLTATQLTYGNGDGTWESADGTGSVYLEDLAFSEQDGLNWFLALTGDGVSAVAGSMITAEGQQTPDHVGGDIGSPGPGFPTTGDDADFNGDGTVDAADYVVWRNSLGATGITAYSLGDANGDGTVDTSDYAVWKNQFGTSPGSLAMASNVPEPSALTVAMLLGIVTATTIYRRK